MATKTKHRRPPARPVRSPQQRAPSHRPSWLLPAAAAAVLLALAAGLGGYLATRGSDAPVAGSPPAGGLPDTPDYHSLAVEPGDGRRLVLGTHAGLHRSADGGRSWTFFGLEGRDAMNLGGASGRTLWAAGHEVLARSDDGGRTWRDVEPEGLPGLDVHGFAIDPRRPRTLYAAVAGQGLYRSRDAGGSFVLVSREVGPGVMALAVTRDGRLLAGEMRAGLMESRDGGATWTQRLSAGLAGLAVSPHDPERVLATGPGILLSQDGGRTWDSVLGVPEGAGPVAWAPGRRGLAYAVGFDRVLYRTTDAGATWKPVGPG